MSYRKNRTEILDDTIKKAEIEEHNLGWNDDYNYGMENDYDYSFCSCDLCRSSGEYVGEYDYHDSKESKNGKMIDLDSISVSRKRNSTIDKILGEEVGVTTIGDVINAKL